MNSFFIQGTINQNTAGGPNACVAADMSFIQLLARAAQKINITSQTINTITTAGKEQYDLITGGLGIQGLELENILPYMNIADSYSGIENIGAGDADEAYGILNDRLEGILRNLRNAAARGLILVAGGQAIGIYLSHDNILLFDSHSRAGEPNIMLSNSFIFKCSSIFVLMDVIKILYPQLIIEIEGFGAQMEYLMTDEFPAPTITFEGHKIPYPNMNPVTIDVPVINTQLISLLESINLIKKRQDTIKKILQ